MPQDNSHDEGEIARTDEVTSDESRLFLFDDGTNLKQAPPKAEGSRKPPGANLPKSKSSSEER